VCGFNHQLYFVLKPIIGVTFELTRPIIEINSLALFYSNKLEKWPLSFVITRYLCEKPV